MILSVFASLAPILVFLGFPIKCLTPAPPIHKWSKDVVDKTVALAALRK